MIRVQDDRLLGNAQDTVARIATEQGAGKIVVGVPVRLDGHATAQTEYTLKFVEALRGATALPVEQWDERLTSAQAERAMLEDDVSRKKRRANIDKLAAQLMLQSYLDAKNGEVMEEQKE